MIWVSRIAFLFGGLVVAGVAFVLYFIVAGFFTTFLLGIQNEAFLAIQYWVCLVAGSFTSFYLLRRSWPKVPPSKESPVLE